MMVDSCAKKRKERRQRSASGPVCDPHGLMVRDYLISAKLKADEIEPSWRGLAAP